jgi:fatty acid desaturase
VATGAGAYPILAAVFPLSAVTLGLFFSRTRAFCEHVSATRAADACFARSHEPNVFDRVFFYTLNMNLHVEHHWFPQIPARNLPRLRRLLNERGCLSGDMTSGSLLGTIAAVLRQAGRTVRPRQERLPA